MAQTPAVRVAGGQKIDYTPGSDVTGGQVVIIGTIPFIASTDITASVVGSLEVEGIFDVPKATGALTAGDAIYWNTTGNPNVGTAGTGAATGTASGNYLMGVAVLDAASGDTYVRVKLTAARRTATIAGSVTADDITGSDSSLAIVGQPTTAGGAVIIAGGASSGGNNNGGALTLRGGAKNGSGTDGAIAIGDTNTSSVTFGKMPRIPTATVAAAGSVQGDAGTLTEGFTLVTAADDTKGVVLPSAVAGMQCIVKSSVANKILKVYPNTSDAINALSANAAISLASGPTIAHFIAYDATTWYTLPLLPS